MIEDDKSLSINMIAREVGIDWKTVLLILRKSCTAEESKQPFEFLKGPFQARDTVN